MEWKGQESINEIKLFYKFWVENGEEVKRAYNSDDFSVMMAIGLKM